MKTQYKNSQRKPWTLRNIGVSCFFWVGWGALVEKREVWIGITE